jgi:UDP-N-acetylmuramyl tripeptide synthase
MVVLRVKDIRGFYARVAADFYPGRPGTIAAVTGTNGKTSTVCFLRDLWTQNSHNSLSLGTLGLQGRDKRLSNLEAGLTTYDAKTLHTMLGEMERVHGVTHSISSAWRALCSMLRALPTSRRTISTTTPPWRSTSEPN